MGWFLGVSAFLFVLVAVIVDLRRKEVPNWVSFSFIAFMLVARVSSGVLFGNWEELFGAMFAGGILFLVGLGLYAMRGFGGGDVKLLVGIGLALPVSSFLSGAIEAGIYFLVLSLAGVVYSLFMSFIIAGRDVKRFGKELWEEIIRNRIVLSIILAFGIGVSFLFIGRAIFVSIFLFLALFMFLKAVDKMMVVLKSAKELEPGEWMQSKIKVNGKWIIPNMHGLSWSEIQRLRKAGKKVWIKEGIAFTPSFLIVQLAMVCAELFLLSPLSEFLLSLLQSFLVLAS